MILDLRTRVRTCISCNIFPQFMLNGRQLSFVNEFKYLRHILDGSLSDVKDIKRKLDVSLQEPVFLLIALRDIPYQ